MTLLNEGIARLDAPPLWRFGDAELDESQARLTVDGAPVALDRSSYDLLVCLLRHAGDVVEKDELLRAGWPGRVVSENSLAKAIGRLRLALGDPDGARLRVVHGYGYRLVADVQRLDAMRATTVVAAVASDASDATGATAAARARVPTDTPAVAPRREWRVLALAAVVAVGLGAIALLRLAPVAPPVRPSVAVLPFTDASPLHDQRYFVDGLVDEVYDDLSRLPQLRVASSISPADAASDGPAIGRALGATAVVEGSVRKTDDRVHVDIAVRDTRDGRTIWSETYDRPLGELFALQDDLSRGVIAALRIELLPAQRVELARHGTASPEAYRELLFARHVFQDDETAQRRSIAAFERAVALDPNYVEAWLGLANVLGHSGIYADSADEALAGKRRAMEAIDHVLTLAPQSVDAYLLRGDLKYAHWWDWSGGEADLEKAAALSSRDNPSYLLRLARLRAALGRLPEALALLRRASELRPEAGAWTVMGYHYTALGQFDQARAALTEALRLGPLDEHARYYLGLGELLQGRPAQALPHFEASAHYLRLTGLAVAYHSLGDAAASERNLQLLITRFGHISPYQVAEVHAWRGENDAAFRELDRAADLRDASIMYLKFDPLLRPIRSDPRYRALLERVNLPP